FIKRVTLSCVTEIVRNQIEALTLCRTVPGEINDHGIFRISALKLIEWARLQRRCIGNSTQSPQSRKNVFLVCLIVEQGNNLNMVEASDRPLLAAYFRGKTLRISDGILQIVL